MIHTHSLRFPSSLYKPLLATPPHLRLDVSVVVVLEQQRCGFRVIFASSYMQGRKADLAFSIMLQQQGHHRVVALLKSDGQRGKTVLLDGIGTVKKTNKKHVFSVGNCGSPVISYIPHYLSCNALVPVIFQQVSHHLQVILLSSHVEGGEAILQQQ